MFGVFPTAVVEPAISIFKKSAPTANSLLEVISIPRKTDLESIFINDGLKTQFSQRELTEKEGYVFNYKATTGEKQIARNIWKNAKPLSKYFLVSAGVKPYEKGKGNPVQTEEILRSKPFESYEKHDEDWRSLIRGGTIGRYTDAWNGEYIKYGEWLAAPRSPKLFEGNKLFIRRTSDYLLATYFSNGKVGNNSVHCIYSKPENTAVSIKYLLGLLNSKLMNWVYRYENFHMVGKPFAEVKIAYVERLPIVVADNQQHIIDLVDKLLTAYQERFDKAKMFTDYLLSIYKPKKISEKLATFYKLDFATFIVELKNSTFAHKNLV